MAKRKAINVKKTLKTMAKAEVKTSEKKYDVSMMALTIVVVITGFVMLSPNIKFPIAVKLIKADKIAEWGPETGKNAMTGPTGAAVSPDNAFLYIASLGTDTIYKYKLPVKPGEKWQQAHAWGGKGDTPGKFNEPSGISVDKNGNIYIADAVNSRIQVFDENAKFKFWIDYPKYGFYRTRNVFAGSKGMIYIADTGMNRIWKFDQAGNNIGNPAGFFGKGLGQFHGVFGLAADSTGRIYAADVQLAKIEVFSQDLISQAHFNVKASGDSLLAFDSQDRLYVVSPGTQEILVYNTKNKNKYIGTIRNDAGNNPLFIHPAGIAIDGLDNIYITESTKNTVLKIRPVF